MTTSNTYLLRMSKEHAHAVSAALDLVMRIDMGQLKEICRELEGRHGKWEDQREPAEQLLDQLKTVLFPGLNANSYYGIMSKEAGKGAHLCFEVRNAIRHRMAWTERLLQPGEFASNDHFEPILFPSGITPPQCISEDGGQPELEYSGQRLAREIEQELGTTNIKEALRVIKQLKEVACQKNAKWV